MRVACATSSDTSTAVNPFAGGSVDHSPRPCLVTIPLTDVDRPSEPGSSRSTRASVTIACST